MDHWLWPVTTSIDLSLATLLQVMVLLSTGGANGRGYYASKCVVIGFHADLLFLHGLYFNTVNNEGIHSYPYIFLLGILMSQYALIGYDASAHMVAFWFIFVLTIVPCSPRRPDQQTKTVHLEL
ncbi:hypothetical protein SELMODRAFT_425459 [Selaginella moellendorffii]|uniref:Uncharacterized protein n=1 Tax=Selaginella moellendorffii TaxID=88036 RepID=D8ST61_SELML|nr:hypothetical protein SELMODRAFT_425459 [Selaginella moellendorffii]